MAVNKKLTDPNLYLYDNDSSGSKSSGSGSTGNGSKVSQTGKIFGTEMMEYGGGNTNPAKKSQVTTVPSAESVAINKANAAVSKIPTSSVPATSSVSVNLPTYTPITASVGNFSYNPYAESEEVTNARNNYYNHANNKVSDWTGGTYGDALQQAMDKIVNREKFSYDLNGDALYQQYKDQYMNLGNIAMQDAIGQASAMTGGYGNSYASTVGNQAYQSYLSQLNDKIPELYSLALDTYNNEANELYNQMNMYNNAYNTEYGQYRDQVSDWNTEANRLQNDYYNAYNKDYGQYSDDYNRAFANYQQGVSENQFAQNLANNQAQFAQNLALEKAQLEENIRSNQANEAYKNASLAADVDYRNASLAADIAYNNAKLSSSQAQASSDAQTSAQTQAKYTENVKNFSNVVMSPEEFAQRGKKATIDGKSYNFDDYNSYISAVLEKWYNNDDLGEEEVAHLKHQYGL